MYIRSFRDSLPCLLFAPHPPVPTICTGGEEERKGTYSCVLLQYSTVVPGYVLFLPSSLSGWSRRKRRGFPSPLACVAVCASSLPPSLPPTAKRKRDREEKYYYHFYFPLPSVCTATICTAAFAGSSYTLISFYDDDAS